MTGDLLYKTEVYEIIGAAMEVYNELGPGFLESVYQEALQIELNSRAIPFVAFPELLIHYKDQQLEKHFFADLLVWDKIIIELKAVKQLTTLEEAQLINELKASRCQLGLLINFCHPYKLDWMRRINTPDREHKAKTNH